MDVDQLRAVRAILRWDDSSTAAELVYYFVHELNVKPIEAWKAVYCQRSMSREPDELQGSAFGGIEAG